ncbi:TPA: hypothetical protein ACQUHN_004162 [Bacillus thuringiensis]
MSQVTEELKDLFFNLKQLQFPPQYNDKITFEITDSLGEEVLMYYHELQQIYSSEPWDKLMLQTIYENYFNQKIAELDDQEKSEATKIYKIKQQAISHVKNCVTIEYQKRTNLIRNALDYTIGTLNMVFYCTLQKNIDVLLITNDPEKIDRKSIETLFKTLEDTEYTYQMLGYNLEKNIYWKK